MYVRLAFAVAAHLESEILIVDEVLAVGDAEFQKKCLGKMGDVSKGEGRTVLFVSHNMQSISALCNHSILLQNGSISAHDLTNRVISTYMSTGLDLGTVKSWKDIAIAPGNDVVKLLGIRAVDTKGVNNTIFDITQPIGIELEYKVLKDNFILWHGLNFHDENGINIFDSHSVTSQWYNKIHPTGTFKTTAWVPGNFLNEGKIVISAAIFNHKHHHLHLYEKDVISLEICDYLRDNIISSRGHSTGKFAGVVRPLLEWK
jgi:lipopolysaccharide transport system ATP-binding protein